MPRLLDADLLQTVHNYAAAYVSASGKQGVTVGYIYKLIREKKLQVEVIDGVQFILLPPPQSTGEEGGRS